VIIPNNNNIFTDVTALDIDYVKVGAFKVFFTDPDKL